MVLGGGDLCLRQQHAEHAAMTGLPTGPPPSRLTVRGPARPRGSLDGGRELLEEFCPSRASNSVTRAASTRLVSVKDCTAASSAVRYAATTGGTVARISSGSGGTSTMLAAYGILR